MEEGGLTLLGTLTRLAEAKDTLETMETALSICSVRLESLSSRGARLRKQAKALELARHRLTLIRKRAEASPFSQLQRKQEELAAVLVTAEEEVVAAEKKVNEAKAKVRKTLTHTTGVLLPMTMKMMMINDDDK